MILRKSIIGVLTILLIAVVSLIWFAVVTFASIWIGGLDQCAIDGCGPNASIWQDVIFVLFLVVPPLVVSLVITGRAAKKILF